MATDDTNADEQQARLDTLIDEFRQAQQRRLVKRGLALLNRTTVEHVAGSPGLPFEKLN